MTRTRVWGALAGARPALVCNFYWSTFCLNGYNGALYHAKESLLNAFSTYVASAVGATATSSRDLVDFVNIDDAHTATT